MQYLRESVFIYIPIGANVKTISCDGGILIFTKKKHFIEDHPTKDSRQIYFQIDKLFHRRLISHVFTYRGPMLTLSCGGSHLELAIDKKKKKKKIVRDHPMTTGIHIQFGYKVIAIPHMALWVWYAKMFS